MPEFDYRDVLLKAASLVEEEGRWVQGEFFRSARNGQRMTLESVIKRGRQDEVGVCAVGAIRLTSKLLDVTHMARQKAELAFASVVGVIGRGPWQWNDVDGRTAAEVAEAMREAAE